MGWGGGRKIDHALDSSPPSLPPSPSLSLSTPTALTTFSLKPRAFQDFYPEMHPRPRSPPHPRILPTFVPSIVLAILPAIAPRSYQELPGVTRVLQANSSAIALQWRCNGAAMALRRWLSATGAAACKVDWQASLRCLPLELLPARWTGKQACLQLQQGRDSSVGRASDRRFEGRRAAIAQLGERQTEDLRVERSILAGCTSMCGGCGGCGVGVVGVCVVFVCGVWCVVFVWCVMVCYGVSWCIMVCYGVCGCVRVCDPHTPSHTLTHPHTPSHTHTHPHTPTHTHTHPHTPSHTLTHHNTP